MGSTYTIAPLEHTICAYKNMSELLADLPANQTIGNNYIRAWSKINSSKYSKILCSVSGGSDSDIVLDICVRCDKDQKITYVWFDTGLEYTATKEHLMHLEAKYGIKILRVRPKKAIPLTCRNHGQPFLSKTVSEYMMRLQKNGFKWEDESYEELIERYPTCSSALKWWCNEKGEGSSFNISRNKLLKEFILENPPEFWISNFCCKYAKKDPVHELMRDGLYDLSIVGVRKAEGGARATAYKSCFDENDEWDNYRPIFWYTNADKECYEKHFGITHSKCYTEYGLKRTGCCGCPFGRNLKEELLVLRTYEPKLYKAVTNVFKDSYEYTKKYRKFVESKTNKPYSFDMFSMYLKEAGFEMEE